MDQKTQFIADYLRQSQSISELCLHWLKNTREQNQVCERQYSARD